MTNPTQINQGGAAKRRSNLANRPVQTRFSRAAAEPEAAIPSESLPAGEVPMEDFALPEPWRQRKGRRGKNAVRGEVTKRVPMASIRGH